ncbi:MAG: helix-turn-helix domain-containing protein, partial [Limosilactobacillus sp.]|nr:helix-turn-helix domain-containing protein [Limosilactobacillus sp.]
MNKPTIAEVKAYLKTATSLTDPQVMAWAADERKGVQTALNQFKKEYVTKILNETGWNQTAAAKILDIQRTYVSKLMNEL